MDDSYIRTWFVVEARMRFVNQQSRQILHQNLQFPSLASSEQWDFPGWALKPKLHMLGHTVYDIASQLEGGSRLLPSCLMWACEGNEDVIGLASRISRRVHQKNACSRILDLYLTKCHALYRRHLKGHTPSKRAAKKRARES